MAWGVGLNICIGQIVKGGVDTWQIIFRGNIGLLMFNVFNPFNVFKDFDEMNMP